jgi:hypothetical protein
VSSTHLETTGHIHEVKAVIHSETGPADDVLQLVERPVPEPGPGQVRVRVVVSGVNPINFSSDKATGPCPPRSSRTTTARARSTRAATA